MEGRDAKVLWPVLTAAAIAVVAVTAVLLWPATPTSLRVDNPLHNSSGEGQGDATTDPYRFETFALCVAHGSVTVSKVYLNQPQHLVLVDWALGPPGSSASVRLIPPQGRVDDIEFADVLGDAHYYRHYQVTNGCSDPTHPRQGGQQLLVSVRRTAAVGSAHGIIVESTSGTVTIPDSLQLCAKTCPAGPP